MPATSQPSPTAPAPTTSPKTNPTKDDSPANVNESKSVHPSPIPGTAAVNPTVIPTVIDNRGANGPDDANTFQSVGAPIVPPGPITVVQEPVHLANQRTFDPSNPAGADRIDLGPGGEEGKGIRDEIARLSALPFLTSEESKKLHELHYDLAKLR